MIRPDSFLKTPSSKIVMSNFHTPKTLTFEPNLDIQSEIEIDDVEIQQVALPELDDEVSFSSDSFVFSYPSDSATSSPVASDSEWAEEGEREAKEEEEDWQQEIEQEKQQERENEQEEEEEQMEGENQQQEQEEQENQDMSTDFYLNLYHSSLSSDISAEIYGSADSCGVQESDVSSLPTSVDSWSSISLYSQMVNLVKFIIFKYRLKDPIITMKEMQEIMTDEYDQFPMIFKRASKCLEVICGIDIKEVDSTTQTYVLLDSLSLTYDGILTDKSSMPSKGLLVIVLGVIFIEGNCVPEEDMWNYLNIIGVYAGRSHFIYGEPSDLLTKEWVKENYLKYQKVPNSNPPCYNFLWGPRAYAEINKIEVMQFLIKIKMTDPTSFLFWYQKALKDDENRIRNTAQPRDSTTATSTTATRTELLSEPPSPTEE